MLIHIAGILIGPGFGNSWLNISLSANHSIARLLLRVYKDNVMLMITLICIWCVQVASSCAYGSWKLSGQVSAVIKPFCMCLSVLLLQKAYTSFHC